MTPKESILIECGRRGRDAVIRDCVVILEGGRTDEEFLRAIGGPPAESVLDGTDGGYGGPDGYWPRVWAARGLLHVWDDVATEAIIDAAAHDAWRVREMAAKVIARHHVHRAIDVVVSLMDDENARVRSAATRAFYAIAQ